MKRKHHNPFFCTLLILASLSAATLTFAAEPTVEQRLQRLEDIESIRTLLLNYGRHVDNRAWDAFAALFAEDGGTWNGGMGIARGQAEIKRMMVDSIGTSPNRSSSGGHANLHLYSNEFIDVNGDTATALSKWVFVMTAADGGPESVFVGHYQDSLVRISGEWKFKERVVLGDIMRPTAVAELNATNE